MPSFTVNDVGSSLVLIAVFFVIRRIVENELANCVLAFFPQPRAEILKDPQKEHKYREGCWKFFIHAWTVAFGLVTLLPSDYLYESKYMWIEFEKQVMTETMYWYYMLELAYYCTEMLTHCVAVRRKDFFLMLLHHVVTILLIVTSYQHNFFRVGTLLMLFHDIMDPFLELAKLAKYLKLKTFSYLTFLLLTVTYFYTRLYLIPFYVWKSILYEVPIYVFSNLEITTGYFLSLYYFCNALIAILMALNCMWAYFLVAAIIKFTSGQELADTRSDDEHYD